MLIQEHPHPRMMTTSLVQIGNQGNQLPPPPPPPMPRPPPPTNLATERRMRAVAVDRFSRVAFPLTFAVLNCIYWITFADYL